MQYDDYDESRCRVRPIGGYFELELPRGKLPYPNAVPVNFGRGGLALIVHARNYRRIWIPDYICPVVPRYLTRLGIDYAVYEINLNLEPVAIPTLGSDEAFLYVNYFGVKDTYCRKLEHSQKNLILDLTQAFYYEPTVADGFNSARKFFGVPDGAFVFGARLTDKDLHQTVAYDQFEPLLRRADNDLAGGYSAFHALDDARENLDAARMAPLTRLMIASLDVTEARARRDANFVILATTLTQTNELKWADASSGALVYPYLVHNGEKLKKLMIDKNIFCPTYWPDIKGMGAAAKRLVNDLVCVPCDQRYGSTDMEFILAEMRKCIRD